MHDDRHEENIDLAVLAASYRSLSHARRGHLLRSALELLDAEARDQVAAGRGAEPMPEALARRLEDRAADA